MRVYSGELKANSRVLNPGKDKKENVAQLWHIQADRARAGRPRARPATSSASSACDTRSPATRSATRSEPILLETIEFPETVISMAIEPERSTERKKLADTLEMLKRQDPTFRAQENEETGQTLISGMGELHLEVIKHRLLRDFNLNVESTSRASATKETVKAGRGHRQMPSPDRRPGPLCRVPRTHQIRGKRQAMPRLYQLGDGRCATRSVHPDDADGAL